MKKLMFFVLVASLMLAAPAFSATICVNTTGTPPCYGTIQAAVDAANPGDIIQIQQGRYNENVEVGTPGVTIEGVNVTTSRVKGVGTVTVPAGAGVVVIDALEGCMEADSIGTQQAGEAAIYIEADNVTVRNLTVRHSCVWNIHSVGNNTVIDKVRALDGSGGIFIENLGVMSAQEEMMSATVQNSEIAFNGPGGGVWIISPNAKVFSNKVLNNFNIGVLVEGPEASVTSNKVSSVGASIEDIMPTQMYPMPDVHGMCIGVDSEDFVVQDNTIANCALVGIGADGYGYLVKNNTIDSALIGILQCGAFGVIDTNVINGVLAGLVSFSYMGGSLSDDFLNSLLGGTLAQDLPTFAETVKQQEMTPSENGYINTYLSNKVKNALVVGYMIMGYDIQIKNNRSENVPSTIIADYISDTMSMGEDNCGFLVDASYADISDNYSSNSSTGFSMELSSSWTSGNQALMNTFNGFYIDFHGYNLFENNTARYNGGNYFWTGGYDIWNCYCAYSEITKNLAEYNGQGLVVGSSGINGDAAMAPSTNGNGCPVVVNNNTAKFNRTDGMIFWSESMYSACFDATGNISTNNSGDGIVNDGASFGLFTGNVATGDRIDICKSCAGGMFPAEPPVGNTYNTWSPEGCSFDMWREWCMVAP